MLCKHTGHVKPGHWYSVVGNNTALYDIPPQIFYVRAVKQVGAYGRPFVVGDAIVDILGKVQTLTKQTMFLDMVGVYDSSSESMTTLKSWRLHEHGRLLVRHDTKAEALKAFSVRCHRYRELNEALSA